MSIKKFIKKVKSLLDLDNYSVENKKKALKDLLKKLRKRKNSIKISLKTSLDKKEKKNLNEELEIISLHIKKGKKILKDLYSNKS